MDADGHRAGLLRLGFPERVVDEAIAAREKGLFRLEPPADAVERIMAAIAHLLPDPSPRLRRLDVARLCEASPWGSIGTALLPASNTSPTEENTVNQTDAVRERIEEGLPHLANLDIRDGTSAEGEHLDLFVAMDGIEGKDWEILQPVTVSCGTVSLAGCTIHASPVGKGDYNHVSSLGSADDSKVPEAVLSQARDLVERVASMDLPAVAAEAASGPTP